MLSACICEWDACRFFVKRASRNEGEKRYRLRCITDAVEQENTSR